MHPKFQKKVVLVTGGSAGIGAATAKAFAREGASVVIADVSEKEGQNLVQTIRNDGGEALFVKTDVSDSKQVAALFERIQSAYQRLDIAFNNAGIEGKPAPTADTTEENFDRTIAINLKGIWLCMKHEIPMMVQQGGGAIVNMASIAGLVGSPNVPAYTASKHGVVGLTKNAALEYGAKNVRVNAVCPGVIMTEMIERFTGGDEEVIKGLAKDHPLGRIGKPEEVAETVLFLSSDAASFITGQALAVDGGFVAK